MVIPKINSAHGSDTRNILNRAIDLINAQGKSIQDLVAEGQLTPSQYAQLISIINGNIKTGNIKTEDLDKNNFKIDQTMITDELRRQITGDAPINAVPANNSIGSEKLIDNSVTKSKKTIGGETGTILSWNKLPDIDLVNKKVVFYRNTGIIHSKGRNVVSTEMSVDFVPGSGISIIYDTSTGVFRSTNSSNANTLGETEVFVTSLSFTSTSQTELLNVVGNLEYTVNGKNRIIKDSVHTDEIVDGAVTASKTNFIEVMNLFNKNEVMRGYSVNGSTGELTPSSNQNTTKEFIYVQAGTTYSIVDASRVSYYNDGEFISSSPLTSGHKLSTAPANANKALLTVSSVFLESAMMYEGEEEKEYTPFFVKVMGVDITKGEKDTSAKQIYFPPEEIKTQFISPDYDYKQMTLQEYYDAFDNLVDAHPEHLIKNVFGKDESGQYDVIQHHYIPLNYHNDEGKIARPKPKITFISNVHGFEKPTALATYYMIKAMLEDWRTNDAIEYLRSNVEMVFIAIANPYGYVNGTYKNGNPDVPVNIQTNFPINWLSRDPSSSVYGGTEPLSERETQYISQMIQEHSDSLFFVDSHSAGSVATQTPENMFYFIGPSQQGLYNEIIEESMKNSVENLSRELSKHYLHDFEGVSGYYYLRPGNGNTEPYAASLGVPAYVSELFYSLPDDELAYQPTAIKAMTETFANTLLTTLKTFKERM